MLDDNLFRKLEDVTQKMPLEQIVKQKQEINSCCPYHLNNLNDVQSEQVIYRIEPFNCFLDNIKEGQLYFAWPGIWTDKFDGAFVRTPVCFPKDNYQANQTYKNDYFCQCWSSEESEVMWKQYSSKPYETVMIVSTVDKIMKHIWTGEACGKYIGKVAYHPVRDMSNEEFFQLKFVSHCYLFNEKGMAQTFLFKPDELSYEKEMRFIAKEVSNQQRSHIFVKVAGNPCDYIDQILIDPRACQCFEDNVQNKLSKYSLIVEKSNKNPNSIKAAETSKFYKADQNNYGLPNRYSFSK